ncbi:hypothetical protein ZEAMMB73_Zm00001d041649 [Zea mays]|nr:hypothetical protein ZEAMMB73_Zm00001d041649 [Zea mays]
MNQLESSSVTRGRGKNKRIWTYYEDEELIKALYEISLDPKWKSEGGFKNGYCSVLENELKARLPGCGLSAIPHIESRVRHFRTKYGSIEVMLAKSGFNQMTMLFALPETLRREFILNMIADEAQRK